MKKSFTFAFAAIFIVALAIVAFACGCASRAHQYRVPGDESSSSSVLGFAREIEAHALGSVSGLAGSESVPTLLVS